MSKGWSRDLFHVCCSWCDPATQPGVCLSRVCGRSQGFIRPTQHCLSNLWAGVQFQCQEEKLLSAEEWIWEKLERPWVRSCSRSQGIELMEAGQRVWSLSPGREPRRAPKMSTQAASFRNVPCFCVEKKKEKNHTTKPICSTANRKREYFIEKGPRHPLILVSSLSFMAAVEKDLPASKLMLPEGLLPVPQQSLRSERCRILQTYSAAKWLLSSYFYSGGHVKVAVWISFRCFPCQRRLGILSYSAAAFIKVVSKQ